MSARRNRVPLFAAIASIALACGANTDVDPRQVDLGPADALDARSEASESRATALAQRERTVDSIAEIVGDDAARRLTADWNAAGPVHRLELSNSNVVEWHEPSEGIGIVVEIGSDDTLPATDLYRRGLTATELFLALAPGKDVPVALAEMERRQTEIAAIYAHLQQSGFYEESVFPSFDTGLDRTGTLLTQATEGEESLELGRLTNALTSAECLAIAEACDAFPWDWQAAQQNRTSESHLVSC